MRKLITVVFMVCSTSLLFAQNNSGSDNLGDITFEELKDSAKATPYFAIAGGFVGNFLFINKDNLSKNIPAPYTLDNFSSPLLLTGGQGFAAIGIISNVRVGFSGIAGSQIQEKDTNSIKTTKEFSASMNGLSVDYAIPVFHRFTILPGVMLGWGTMNFESSSGPSTLNWADIGVNKNFRTDRLQETHYFACPQVNIEYAYSGLMLRFNAGYATTFSSDWKENGISVINNTPSPLNASGLILGFGIFAGLFN